MAEKFPWFKCYPSKLLGALASMPPSVQLVYVTVLLRIYEHGEFCPDNAEALARRTGLKMRVTADALRELCENERLVLKDKRYFNPFADALLKERRSKTESALEQRRNAARARWQKTEESQRNGHADGMRPACDPHQNIDLELDKRGKKESPPNPPRGSREKPKPAKKPKRKTIPGTTLPEDWAPADSSIARGRRLGLVDIEIQDEADVMRSWAKANAHRSVAHKADWDAAFESFLHRRANEKKEKGGINGRPWPTSPAGASASRPKTLAEIASAAFAADRTRQTTADDRPDGGSDAPSLDLLPPK